MSLSSPWQAPENLTAFERAARQIAEEERQLRLIAESQLHEYVRLTIEFAGLFLADDLDQRTRADPLFVSRATPEVWRSLLQGVRLGRPSRVDRAQDGQASGNSSGWMTETPPAEASDRWRAEAESLQSEVARLQAENRLLRALVRPTIEPPADALPEAEMTGVASVPPAHRPAPAGSSPPPGAADRPVLRCLPRLLWSRRPVVPSAYRFWDWPT